jgi:hypothetical protein
VQFLVIPALVALSFYYKPKIDLSSTPITLHFTFWIGILLMPLNWILEYAKWIVILKRNSIPQTNAKMSFASGVLSEFLIPGIPSNFIGRIFYFEKENRFKLSAWIQLANLTQFFITLVFGIFSMFFLNLSLNSNSIYYILILALIGFFVFCFYKLKVISLPNDIRNYAFVQHDLIAMVYLLLISLFRFLVFSTQFGLILHSFSIPLDFQLFTYIWISYLFVSFSPSLFLGNIVIRESITVSVFEMANYPILPVLYATFFIWLANNFLPVCLAWCYVTFVKRRE